MGSCRKDESSTPSAPIRVTGPPVETNPANTTYKPAFSGQTRIGSTQTSTPFSTTVITSSLTAPWGIAALPDGKLLGTQKGGGMCMLTTAGVVTSVSIIPAVNTSGQGDPLGLCIDLQFAINRVFYWTFFESVIGGNIISLFWSCNTEAR